MIRSNAVVSVAPEASVIAVTSRSVRPNSVTAATPRQPSAGRVDGRSAKASNAASRPSIADTSAFIDAMISAVLDVLYRSSASRYSRRLSPKVSYMLWRLRPMCVSSASVDAPSYPWLANTSIALPRTWSRSNSFGRAMSGWYEFWTDMSRTVDSRAPRPRPLGAEFRPRTTRPPPPPRGRRPRDITADTHTPADATATPAARGVACDRRGGAGPSVRAAARARQGRHVRLFG